MKALLVLIDCLSLMLGPFVVLGVINRVKAFWAGRRGAPVLQPLYDVVRLFRKDSVISTTTTFVFTLGAIVVWLTSISALLFMPGLSGRAFLTAPYDFVFAAYALGLGRIALMLSALDTGSAFEGMGASREATFATLAEPVLFLVLGTLAIGSGQETLGGLVSQGTLDGAVGGVVIGLLLIACLALLQIEAARMPIDDPTTHLELTMVHEVMVLDHSGFDLALVQHAAALKTFFWCELIVAIAVPATWGWELAFALRCAALCVVAVTIGLIESTIARLKLQTIPRFISAAIAASLMALIVSAASVPGVGP